MPTPCKSLQDHTQSAKAYKSSRHQCLHNLTQYCKVTMMSCEAETEKGEAGGKAEKLGESW